MSNAQLVSLLEATADDRGTTGYDVAFGHGRVNAFRALTAAAGGPDASPGPEALIPVVAFTGGPPEGARLTSSLVSVAGTAAAPSGLDRV
jgi:hypothetical protein